MTYISYCHNSKYKIYFLSFRSTTSPFQGHHGPYKNNTTYIFNIVSVYLSVFDKKFLLNNLFALFKMKYSFFYSFESFVSIFKIKIIGDD